MDIIAHLKYRCTSSINVDRWEVGLMGKGVAIYWYILTVVNGGCVSELGYKAPPLAYLPS